MAIGVGTLATIPPAVRVDTLRMTLAAVALQARVVVVVAAAAVVIEQVNSRRIPT
jgi:hypothetical protein